MTTNNSKKRKMKEQYLKKPVKHKKTEKRYKQENQKPKYIKSLYIS